VIQEFSAISAKSVTQIYIIFVLPSRYPISNPSYPETFS
jgi:hypothetical protein